VIFLDIGMPRLSGDEVCAGCVLTPPRRTFP
jgi:hypothetical protein